MAGFDDEGRILGQLLEVFLDQAVLQPVLAGLAGLAVGDELVGIERDLEIEVVVDHDLECLAFDALALVFVDRLAVNSALRTVAVGIDAAAGHQLIHEFRGELFVQLLRNVAQRIAKGKLRLGLGEAEAAVGRAAVAVVHLRVFRKDVVELDRHSSRNGLVVHVFHLRKKSKQLL